jgi:dTDP-4-dehydrorhamnose 3,5-epimerase
VQIEATGIDGAWLCTPRQFPDDRGVFLEWFRADLLAEQTRRRFDVVQANHSISRRGTLRGLHLTDVPPGQAKYVYCPRGAVLDVVVDVRDGSPTYGEHVTVTLDDRDRRGLFIAEGLAHAFCALTETAEITYLVSTTYDPAVERSVNPLDSDLAIAWPADIGALVMSDKDRAAPTLAQARTAGTLPSYDACRARYDELR